MNSFMSQKSKYEVMEEITDQVQSLLEDLCQSGFDTVHDATLRDLEKMSALTKQYGMEYLAELLAGLSGEISAGRHRMKRRMGQMAELYTEINEYLYLCRQKTAYDRGLDYYTMEEQIAANGN